MLNMYSFTQFCRKQQDQLNVKGEPMGVKGGLATGNNEREKIISMHPVMSEPPRLTGEPVNQ